MFRAVTERLDWALSPSLGCLLTEETMATVDPSIPLRGGDPGSTGVPGGAASIEVDKGLKKNAVGMLSSIVIGIASTAPAYSLAVTLGLVTAVAGMGLKSPAIMIVSFIPMILIAGDLR